MPSNKEIFTSQKGYLFCIDTKDFNCVQGSIEVLLDWVPIKAPFKGICQYLDERKFDFSFFVEWEPYFKQINTAVSGSYLETEVLLNWMLTANSPNKKSTKVLSAGCDNLVRCELNETIITGLHKSADVPHPFYLDMLYQYTDIPMVSGVVPAPKDH